MPQRGVTYAQLAVRNQQIALRRREGASIYQLTVEFNLSKWSINQILHDAGLVRPWHSCAKEPRPPNPQKVLTEMWRKFVTLPDPRIGA